MSFSYFGGQHLIGHAVDLLVVVAPRARAQVRADPVCRQYSSPTRIDRAALPF
jgi:preprotein translocase subunit SecD